MRAMGTVLISYSHDSEETQGFVRTLADALISAGLAVEADFLGPVPDRGLPAWMERQVLDAEFVLVVCSEGYWDKWNGNVPPRTGLGVIFEGHLIRQDLFDRACKTRKYIPVTRRAEDDRWIPQMLRAYPRYRFPEEGDALCRALRKSPPSFLLTWDGFEEEFRTRLETASELQLVSRTGNGWYTDFSGWLISGCGRRQTRFIFMDPSSAAFQLDTRQFYQPQAKPEPSVDEEQGGGDAGARRWGTPGPKRAGAMARFCRGLQEQAKLLRAGGLELTLKLTDVFITGALVSVRTPQHGDTIYAEIRVRPAEYHGNVYLRVEEREPEFSHYSSLLKAWWETARPFG